MGQVLSFERYLQEVQRERQWAKRASRSLYFQRGELNRLISVYSEQVMAGAWRDYALDHLPGLAVFSVFRSAKEQPLYAVAKRLVGPGAHEYLLFQGPARLGRFGSLEDAIEAWRSAI